MDIRLRPSDQRGHANHGWLDTYHTFSFGDYHDPLHMGFRSLRVINEDYVDGGQGFGTHPHKDMEILTYVVEGALAHKDSMGTAATIKAGEVQKMSAGTGVSHSEFNPSSTQKVHLLQIWILPDKKGLTPSYEQFALPQPDAKKPLQLIASPQGGKNIIVFHQDVELYRGLLKKSQECTFDLRSGRGAWVQMIKGKLELNGHPLNKGDGAAIEEGGALIFKADKDSEFLFFDLR